jgi:ABC-2 type transport system permease protein
LNLEFHFRTLYALFLRDVRLFYARNWLFVVNMILYPIPLIGNGIYQYYALGNNATVSSLLAKYGFTSLSGIVILGTVVYLLYNRILQVMGRSFQTERWSGTLETILLTPASKFMILLANGLTAVVESSPLIFAVIILSWAAFGFQTNVASPALFVVVVISTIVSLLSMGILFSGVYLASSFMEELTGAIQSPLRFITGTTYPVAALPLVLQYISFLFPLTYSIQVLRESVLTGAGLYAVIGYLASLYATSIAFSLVGYVVFVLVERRLRRSGEILGVG